MRPRILFFISTVLLTRLFAGEINLTVTVKDNQTNLPIDSVLVEISGLDNMFNADGLTDSSGAITFLDVPTSVKATDDFNPRTFRMSSPYPQPVRKQTTLEFALPEHADVSITLYNILGQQIIHHNQSLSLGNYITNLSLDNLSAGVYILNIQSDKFSKSTKIVKATPAGFSGGLDINIKSVARPPARGKPGFLQVQSNPDLFQLTLSKNGYLTSVDTVEISSDTTIIRFVEPESLGQGIWQSIGPYGLDVECIAVSPHDPDFLLIASDLGDLYKSSDAGSTWELTAGFGVAVRALEFHPHSPDTIYAGLDLFGVKMSVDGGTTWNTSNNGLQFDPFVYDFAIHPANPDTLYVATFKSLSTGGVYKSVDGGANWAASQTGMNDAFCLTVTIDPNQPNVLYAGTYTGSDGLYKSTDSGASWAVMNNGLTDLDVWSIIVDPQQSDMLYAATAGGGVVKSTDGGGNWQPMNSGITNTDVRILIIDPQSQETLYASGGNGVFKTTDGGQNWSPASTGLTNQVITSLAIDASNSQNIYGGAIGLSEHASLGTFVGGVFKSNSAADNWEFSGTGLHSLDIRAIEIEKNNPAIIYVGTFGKGVLRSLDGGASWNAAATGINLGMSAPDVLDISLNPNVAGELVASTLTAGIYRSTNGGLLWQNVRASGRVQNLVRAPDNSDILFAAHFTDGVLKSADGGSTWAPTSLAQTQIFNIIFDPTDSSIMYAGVNGDGIYKSTDGGDNWEKRSAGMNNQMVRSLTIDAQNTNVLYAGCLEDNNPMDPLPAQIYRTTNGGDTWEVISEGQFEAFVLLVDPLRPYLLYASTFGQGVYQSSDSGVTWAQINEGLANTRVLALVFDPTHSRNVFAGTFGNGVFRIGF